MNEGCDVLPLLYCTSYLHIHTPYSIHWRLSIQPEPQAFGDAGFGGRWQGRQGSSLK